MGSGVGLRKWTGMVVGVAIGSVAMVLGLGAASPSSTPTYRSPQALAYSPDGKMLAVSDRTAGEVAFVKADGSVATRATLAGKLGGLAWSGDGSRVYVAEYNGRSVAEINAADGKVARRIEVGAYPVNVAVAAKRQVLLASTFFDVAAVDLKSGKVTARIATSREPFWITVTPDESLAVVSNLLPQGAGTDAQLTASVSLIDLASMKRVADIKLPANSTSIRQTAVSPDGKWAYAVHTLGRSTLPATQLDRGWVNTNALSIIDLGKKELYASVLLDNLTDGSADPWGIALSADGGTAWITVAGTHQIAKIDLANLHRGLAGQPMQQPGEARKSPPSVWDAIKTDPAKRMDLMNDLSALYIRDLMTRHELPGKGPRGIVVSSDGKQLAVAQYFTGNVVLVDSASMKAGNAISLGTQPQADEARRGEAIFHDANYTFQRWLSCASCHPNDGRADGLNWDLPNDGIGNPKSAKSLLYSHKTGPAMWRGVRDTMETAAMAGFRFAARQPTDDDVKVVQAYIRSLKEDVSPYRLANGDLSEKAKKGKAIFESEKAGCAHCHSGDTYTNGKLMDVGTHGEFDPKEHVDFITPPLIELWRSGPYLHDGRAVTIQEVFSKFNAKDLHGKTSHLSKEEVDALAEYLLSL